MNVMELARKENEYIVSMRRYFHENPEVSWKEENTSNRICQELDQMNIPYVRVCGTGIIATLKGRKEKPVIGLRADIDALPVKEDTDCAYKSKHEGVMHACGHDSHMAMLLGAAKILSAHREELDCTVKFIFQPAEEVIEGAKQMMKLDEMKGIDTIMAIHIYPMLPTGKISVDAGPRMTSADTIKIKIKGKGGHGSQPHNAIDPIMAGSAVVMNLQTIVSREISPLETCVISICSFRGGKVANIIENSAELMGTVRTFNPEVRNALPEKIERVVRETCNALRADCEFEFIYGTPPTINEAESSKRGERAVLKLLGEEGLMTYEKHPGGEDFAWMLEKIPGYLAFVGCGNKEKDTCYSLHHEKFNLDEDAMVNGSALFVQYVLESQKDLGEGEK